MAPEGILDLASTVMVAEDAGQWRTPLPDFKISLIVKFLILDS